MKFHDKILLVTHEALSTTTNKFNVLPPFIFDLSLYQWNSCGGEYTLQHIYSHQHTSFYKDRNFSQE